MPLRRIAQVGRVYPRRHTKNQLRLLEFISEQEEHNVNDGEELRTYLGVDTREEAFEIVRLRYNDYVPQERNRLGRLEETHLTIANQLGHLIELGDVDEITLNMEQYRQDFTLEEILNRIVLAVINDENQENYYTLQIGNNYYTLNDNVRNRLITMVRRDLIIDEEQGSDGVLLQEIKDADEIIVKRWEGNNEYTTPNGAFFKYKNMTNMDFKKYGIFTNHGEWIRTSKRETGVKDKMEHKSNYKDNCFIYALKEYAMKENSTLTMEMVEEVKYYVKNLKVPMNVMPKIADAIQHKIRINNIKYDDKYNTYGNVYENEINLGLIEEHYFLNDTTNFTSFAILNYEEIRHLENYNHIYTCEMVNGKKYYKTKKKRCISSFQAIKLLIENKEKYLKLLTTQETQLAHTQFYNSVEESFENLNYSTKKNIRKIETKNGKKKKPEIFTNVFFDFETNTNEGKHKPYLCCCYYKINGKEYREKLFGYDCGKQLLDFIPDKSMLIAHNASYDFRFIVKCFDRLCGEISKGNRLVSADAVYDGKKIKVKDSYALLAMKLQSFNKNMKLGGDMRKEVISHQLYTQENIDKRFIDIDYAIGFLKSDEDIEQFKKNINEWDLIGENNTFDCLEYSANYCLKDCEILAKGYNVFRGMVFDSVNLNIDNILTIPSLSHQYFIENKCYEDVCEIGGTPQRFIQKSVVGGRCMTNSNLMIMCFEILNDFDAVSLYPSAMSMMGFLKGTPKKITGKKSYDFLKDQDGYFVEILIKKVGIKRDFPSISYIDDDGVRKWSNDMVGRKIYINKISLEDAIEFQNIEFEVVRGYYYNEGKNNNIKCVIKHLFNERKKWKSQGNPIEMIYKLIMNSGYGRSIMKEIETESKFFNTKESFQKYLSKNYNYINEYSEYGNGKYKVKKIKPFNQHFNLAQVGSEILSMSKRIMNQLMYLAEDIGIKLYYTDTDSIHIKDADIKYLSKAYQNKYHKTLIGKELGQFHTDFELKVVVGKDEYGEVKENCKNIVSFQSIFLGKKAYLDWLKGNHPITNEIVYGFHIRMKGVCEGAVYIYADENGMKKDIWKIYKKLYEGEKIKFDLMKGGVLNFKYDKNYDIITDPIFIREVKFSGKKLTIKENGEEVLRTTGKNKK